MSLLHILIGMEAPLPPVELALHWALVVLILLAFIGMWVMAVIYEPERPPSHELPTIPVPDYPSEL